jgi:signal transduction histidine kinase
MATTQTTSTTTRSTAFDWHTLSDRLSTILVFGSIALAVGVFLVAPFLAWRWNSQPFIGAFLEPNLVFNGIGPASWALIADNANDPYGTTYPDRLLEVDGQAVHSLTELNQLLAAHKAGDVVTLTIEGADLASSSLFATLGPYITENNGPHEVQVTLIAFGITDLISYFIIPYIIGLAFLGIGVWVFYLRYRETAGRMFALFCMCMAVITGTNFELYTTQIFAGLFTIAFPFGAASLTLLALVFPEDLGTTSRRPLLRWSVFVPAFAISIAGLFAINGYGGPRWYAFAWLMGFIAIALAALFFLASNIYRARLARSPVARAQSNIVLIGTLGFLPGVGWVIVSTVFPEIKFNSILFAPMILFPAAVAYTLLRYRLINTDYMFSRVIVYSALGLLTTLGYFLLVYGVSTITGSAIASNAGSPFLIGALVFALVLGFNPLRNWLQTQVDALFFRGSQKYRDQLLAFSHNLTESTDLPYIVGQIRNKIETTLRPSHLHIFLRDQTHNDFPAYAAHGRPDTDLRFAADGALAQTLFKERDVLYLAPDMPLPASIQRDRARLGVLGSRLFVPLKSKSGLQGWLALGNQLSGEPFSRQDIEFLESLADQSTLAISRALAFDTLEKRVNELNVLSQVSQAVNFSISFDDLLELVYAQASRVLDLRHFTIIMRDAGTNTLSYVFFVQHNERDSAQENKPWPFGQGLASEVIRSGQTILTQDYLEECARRRITPLNRPYTAWMGVPLNAGSGTLGAMTIASLDPGQTFTDDQLRIFAAIADQAATALEKARLYSQTEERARQLATLNTVAQVITSTLDLDTLLQRVLESAVSILGCEAGSLFLVDDETNDSVLRVAVGPVAKDIIGIRVPAGRGIVGSAAESGQSVIVNDTSNDPRFFQKPDSKTGFVSRALMAVPLRVKDRTVGVLEVINKRNGSLFSQEDTDLLTAFAGQAAVAIENARLFNLTDQALAARVEELSVMQRIVRELNAVLDVPRVMNIILERALAATNAWAGVAGLVVPGNVIQIVAHSGYDETIKPYLETGLPLETSLIGNSVRTRSTAVVRDVSANPTYIQLRADTKSELVIPIVREDETIGILLIEANELDYFVDDHIIFLTRLADQAVIAITNARLYAEVQAANLAKSLFVSDVAHELKNPLQAIGLSSQLMLTGMTGSINETQQDALKKVTANVQRMGTIISDLTDLTRGEAGHLRLKLEPLQFNEVLEEVATSLQGAFESKNQTLTIKTEPDLPLVRGDKNRLIQILTNLTSNAHKYSPEGATVVVSAIPTHNSWDPKGAAEVLHVSVQDNGYGISAEDQKKLFTKFFRADNNKSEAPGTGLGLNIVKQMVELGGGKVWFESQVGYGSTFHFTIPIPRKDTKPLSAVE